MRDTILALAVLALTAGGVAAGDRVSVRLAEASKTAATVPKVDPDLADVAKQLVKLPDQEFVLLDAQEVPLEGRDHKVAPPKKTGMSLGPVRGSGANSRASEGMSLGLGDSGAKRFTATMAAEYQVSLSGQQSNLKVEISRGKESYSTVVALADDKPFVNVLPWTAKSGANPLVIVVARQGAEIKQPRRTVIVTGGAPKAGPATAVTPRPGTNPDGNDDDGLDGGIHTSPPRR
jgi:hypothetical protein